MTWDFAETNFFSNSTGNFLDQVEYPAKSIANWSGGTVKGSINQIDATKSDFLINPAVISTDPPYYDNIGYATLADFFYVWLRPSLRDIWPELFRRLTTPKEEELVATAFLHNNRRSAEEFFMRGMSRALDAMRAAATEEQPLAIYYAFKQSEGHSEGASSAGWAAFLQGVVDAGLLIDGTWPMRTELTGNLKGKLNVLASSIVLVCRKRSSRAPVATRADFLRALKRELPDAIDDIRKAGVGPVDMQQSVIGPGMGVFSRHLAILEADDSKMSVKTALAVINRVWEEIENELDSAFDAETQVALAWYAAYGFDAKPAGELIILANAKNVPLDTLFAAGVFQDLRGRTALMPRGSLPRDWTPSTDARLTVWECVQHTARVLNAEDGGGAPAAKLVAQMGIKASEARALAYRLFEIATQKAWPTEALVYNELAQEWPRLEELAANTASGATTPAQGDMFAEAT